MSTRSQIDTVVSFGRGRIGGSTHALDCAAVCPDAAFAKRQAGGAPGQSIQKPLIAAWSSATPQNS